MNFQINFCQIEFVVQTFMLESESPEFFYVTVFLSGRYLSLFFQNLDSMVHIVAGILVLLTDRSQFLLYTEEQSLPRASQ